MVPPAQAATPGAKPRASREAHLAHHHIACDVSTYQGGATEVTGISCTCARTRLWPIVDWHTSPGNGTERALIVRDVALSSLSRRHHGRRRAPITAQACGQTSRGAGPVSALDTSVRALRHWLWASAQRSQRIRRFPKTAQQVAAPRFIATLRFLQARRPSAGRTKTGTARLRRGGCAQTVARLPQIKAPPQTPGADTRKS